ncbi:MAG: OmpA/MotB family protein [Nitrospiraceae bacterium]
MTLSADAPLADVAFGEGALRFSAGFIRQTVASEGVVAKTPYNRTILGKGDVVYLRMNELEGGGPGGLYSIYRRAQKVFHPANRRYLGDLIYVVGVVRITDISHEFAVATIERSYGPIMIGHGVMPFTPPHEEAGAPGRSLPGTPGMIVDMQPQRTLVAQSHEVYLDWGREEGLAIGDRLEVFRARTGLPDQVVGEVKVVALEDSTATGVVVRSAAPFAIGDRFTFKEATDDVLHSTSESLEKPSARSQTNAHRALTRSLMNEIAKGDITVTLEGDKVKINLGDLVDQLEYEPGQAPIKPAGAKILKQISDILKTMTDQQIQVEGHTDSMPIGPHLMNRFPGNQELSEARASLIVRYFMEEGIDPSTLSAVGYAERRPVASNATDEGRRKNRRIEIELSSKMPSKPTLSTIPSLPEDQKAPQDLSKDMPIPQDAGSLPTGQ